LLVRSAAMDATAVASRPSAAQAGLIVVFAEVATVAQLVAVTAAPVAAVIVVAELIVAVVTAVALIAVAAVLVTERLLNLVQIDNLCVDET
jgi:hypothetical protein